MTAETPIQVLIVDDSLTARATFKALIASDPGLHVQATATDPFDAAEVMRRQVPDVMLLDLELPRMDGLTFLSQIMRQRPMPVVICSSHTQHGSDAALRALEIGAAEVIGKPSIATDAERSEAQIRICDAIRAAAQARHGTARRSRSAGQPAAPARAPAAPVPSSTGNGPKLSADAILPRAAARASGGALTPVVAIGASTGGTEALLSVLRQLPETAPPVVVVQHMPEKFTAAFASRLDAHCRIAVSEARDGDQLVPGRALIAPGSHHLLVERNGRDYRVKTLDGPYVSRHRPSVDVLFRSVAQSVGAHAMGILMTGMGDDGARGLLEMRQAGAETLCQDEASCVVFGMPREGLKIGASDRAVALDRLPAEILEWHKERSPR
ncbi:chemotaxis response regulator protein-glutamate methylesterase [Mesobaculum littorinae]|uniref:Protein-glutamate methylesterase/protein-glutamine glutaminase n=1 Tax=Mesobaculum littorinae TaxID=2486419 RepID=A0A438AMM3_9RHOB|nr:chemotaxis response regulator protein-glutamate methylesterase [Mesobaculum littorinae]RVV99796.1 chemotaxis response regulator protein-glutamate methylesterase [Mesobaculum littorinae]